jgi:hypothetical protein
MAIKELQDQTSQEKREDIQEPSTSKQSSPPKAPEPPNSFETDPQEVQSYEAWHQSFYGRPSVFAPNPPPSFKIPPSLTMSQINVAARYVAGNGAFSERTLLGKLLDVNQTSSEHNNGRLSFLFPNSEYLIYYHCKVRFFQARLNARVPPFVHSKYHKDMEPLKSVPIQPPQPAEPKTNEKQALADVMSNIPPVPQPPEPIKTKAFPDSDSKAEETDESVKRKRK